VTSLIASILVDGANVDKAALRSYLASREIVSVRDYGAAGDGLADDTAPVVKAIAAVSAAGGGVVFMPAGMYKIGQVDVPANVWITGVASASKYEPHEFGVGTTIRATLGDYALFLAGRHSRLSNLTLDGSGGRVAYGVVVNAISTVVESVTVRGVEYGFASAGLNANVFEDISAFSCSKAGFVVLEANNGGIGAYEYPRLASKIVAGASSTIFSVRNFKFRGNRAGIILRDGSNVKFEHGVIESNFQFSLVAFKRGLLDAFTFDNVWFEHDGYAATVAAAAKVGMTLSDDFEISGLEALKTSAAEYLRGDVNGQYSARADGNYAIFFGSAVESHASAFPYGPPAFWTFVNCRLTSAHALFRLRSQVGMTIERCHIQSATGEATVNQTPHSYKLHLIRPRSESKDQHIWGMKLREGTGTLYTFDEAPIVGTNKALASESTSWQDLCDLSVMTPGLRYRYSVSVRGASGWTLYGATGWAASPVSGAYALAKEITGSRCEVRLDGGKLQYQQRSGTAALVDWKIWPDGPTGPV
jgi:hypothetical protein